jgi:hypothetical protein
MDKELQNSLLLGKIVQVLGSKIKDLNLFKSKLQTLFDAYSQVITLIEFQGNLANMNAAFREAPAMAVLVSSFKHLSDLDKDSELKEAITLCNKEIDQARPNCH